MARKGFDNKLVTLEVHNTTDSDVLGNNPIYKDDKVVGRLLEVNMVLDWINL